MDVIVIGAGISGLTAAYWLHQAGHAVQVVEAADQPGGLIRTLRERGYTLEAGPTTFPSTADDLLDLCGSLGITPKPASPLAKKRYLYLNGGLTPLPTQPWQAITTRVLSWESKKALFKESRQPPMESEDPSIADFFRYRLGPEWVTNLVDPFISGVYAGDIQKLSLRAVFPTLWEWEQTHGSLSRGALLNRVKRKRRGPLRLLSFEDGMQYLTKVLAQSLPAGSLRLNTRINSLRHYKDGYMLTLEDGEVMRSRNIIMATSASAAATLLQSVCSQATQVLAGIPYSPIAVVHTAFPSSAIPHVLDGFGFLVPRKEKMALLGSIWASSLFPARTPTDQVLLSSFIGGAHFPGIIHWDSADIEAQVLKDLAQVFKIANPLKPVFSKVVRYDQAIPQYTLGHRQRIQNLQAAISGVSGMALCGNYLSGLALNECVKSGISAAKAILDNLD